MAGAAALAFAAAEQSPATAAVPAGTHGIDVTSKGATGDGVTDDTPAVRASIVAADGGEVYFPPGTYVLDGLVVDATAHLELDPAATLLAKPNSPVGEMFSFVGTELRIRGGSIDGNKQNQNGRPLIFAGSVQKGKSVDVADVKFIGSVKAAFYIVNFGGLLNVEHCRFTNQAEHTGTFNDGVSMILYVTSGQVNEKGYIRFNHNRCVGTDNPALPGGNPGGVFVSPASSDAPLVGNMSTVEAVGNYFWGYGQNCAGNTISPIHLYHSTLGVRISDNYFEECSFSAISAKSVTDFVCTNNVFVGGGISAQNDANAGVIFYVPGYNAGSVVQPRAVITGNIIEGGGGQSSSKLKNGIGVHGTSTSHATDVIVANNVISGGGRGIQVEFVDDIKITGNFIRGSGAVGVQANNIADLTVSGNTIQGGTGAAAGLQSGISIGQVTGEVLISDNIIRSRNGHGVVAVTDLTTARFTVRGNKFIHASAGFWGAVLRGMDFLKLSGNEFNATAGSALSVAADAAGNKVGTLAHDLSNTVTAGLISFNWPNIVKALGQLRAPASPLGVVTPGEVGTSYQQSDGTGAGVAWIAQGTTSGSWRRVLSTSTTTTANRLLGMTYDPIAATTAQASGTGGVLNIAKIVMPEGGVVVSVLFQIVTSGTALAAGRCFVGLYNSAGALIGKTADMATTFATTGNKTVALTAPTASQPQGAEVFVATLWSGTTGPQLRGVAGTGMANIGISAAKDYRFATAGSALTSLPATRPTQLPSTSAPWFGIS
jgi:hypothetical protein